MLEWERQGIINWLLCVVVIGGPNCERPSIFRAWYSLSHLLPFFPNVVLLRRDRFFLMCLTTRITLPGCRQIIILHRIRIKSVKKKYFCSSLVLLFVKVDCNQFFEGIPILLLLTRRLSYTKKYYPKSQTSLPRKWLLPQRSSKLLDLRDFLFLEAERLHLRIFVQRSVSIR